MSAPTCPHGLATGTCQICRVLEPTSVPSPARRRTGLTGRVVGVGVLALVAFVAFGWVAAAFFVVLRILELIAVAAGAGWVGWKLGVRHGRRQT